MVSASAGRAAGNKVVHRAAESRHHVFAGELAAGADSQTRPVGPDHLDCPDFGMDHPDQSDPRPEILFYLLFEVVDLVGWRRDLHGEIRGDGDVTFRPELLGGSRSLAMKEASGRRTFPGFQEKQR